MDHNYSCSILSSGAASEAASATCDVAWDMLYLWWPPSAVCPDALGFQHHLVYTNRGSISIFIAVHVNLFNCCRMDKSFSKGLDQSAKLHLSKKSQTLYHVCAYQQSGTRMKSVK